MKIIPTANNHVELELDLSSYSMKKKVDILEGVQTGIRFIDVSASNIHDASEEITIEFTGKDGVHYSMDVSMVKIILKKEK